MTNKYHPKAIWCDIINSKSKLNALSFKYELNSFDLVYEDCVILNFNIIFVDGVGNYFTRINHENHSEFKFLSDSIHSFLNEFLEDNNELFVGKCEIELIKPLNINLRKKERKIIHIGEKQIFQKD